MPNPYSRREWAAFRAEVIELDGKRCNRCKRKAAEGAVLQVHHRYYIPRKKPWEYPYDACEALCKRCHAEEHGLIPPSFGWDYVGDDDLGDLSGRCDKCGTEIRYVFHIHHPHWEPMEVGTFCCDNLTGTTLASNHMESVTRFKARLERFIGSSRWLQTSGESAIKQKGISIAIRSMGSQYRISMNEACGKAVHPTLTAAKQAAFESLESGKAEEYLRKIKKLPPPKK